jgi:hypothetical protein
MGEKRGEGAILAPRRANVRVRLPMQLQSRQVTVILGGPGFCLHPGGGLRKSRFYGKKVHYLSNTLPYRITPPGAL